MEKAETMKPEVCAPTAEQGTAGFHMVNQEDYVATLATFAEWGDAKAQHNLGAMYLEGQELAQDYAEALKWHTMAAEQGFSLAQHDLATMYLEGLGVPPDLVAALHWFTRAAAQGDAKAQNNLGILYATGQGVEEDVVEAGKWFHLAVARGMLDAIENLEIALEEMTPQQRIQAQKRAEEWQAGV